MQICVAFSVKFSIQLVFVIDAIQMHIKNFVCRGHVFLTSMKQETRTLKFEVEQLKKKGRKRE